jgi:hypothetical protein
MLKRFNVGLCARMLAAALSLAALVSIAGMQSASATTYPSGYCAVQIGQGCVNNTTQIASATNTSASYYVSKGGSLSIQICNSYSNSSSLGAAFGPIKNYLTINASVTIQSSYSICTGASTPVTVSGYYHWYGSAKRWKSGIDGCGRAGCGVNHSVIAQDRWYYKVVAG